MNYFANPANFQKNFIVPSIVAENHLKLATPNQLKVLLYVCNNLSEDPSEGAISSALSIPESEVKDALAYWAAAGLFIPKSGISAEINAAPQKKVVKSATIKPTRSEIARRGMESKQIALLLREAELKFERVLKINEASTLVWLFDDLGMDISLILMLLEYAKSEEKLNVSFVERTAVEWSNNGVEDIIAAEKYITTMYEKKTAWKIVEAAFGIEPRMATTKELDYAELWVKNWGFSREMLRLAYEKCVDSKSKFIMSYTAKILENWHSKGYTSPKEILAEEAAPKTDKNSSMVTYDIKEIEDLFNSDLEEE